MSDKSRNSTCTNGRKKMTLCRGKIPFVQEGRQFSPICATHATSRVKFTHKGLEGNLRDRVKRFRCAILLPFTVSLSFVDISTTFTLTAVRRWMLPVLGFSRERHDGNGLNGFHVRSRFPMHRNAAVVKGKTTAAGL